MDSKQDKPFKQKCLSGFFTRFFTQIEKQKTKQDKSKINTKEPASLDFIIVTIKDT